MNFIKNNPAVFNAIVVSLVTAVLTLLVEAGVPVSDGLSDAITALLVIIGGIVIGIVTRGQVVPFRNVVEYRPVEGGEASVQVVAGPANDQVPPGDDVRKMPFANRGTIDRH